MPVVVLRLLRLLPRVCRTGSVGPGSAQYQWWDCQKFQAPTGLP